ncbi:uncharacterized protein UTRI_04990 [Ustilago trichophora]|uniref:Mig1 protein n=1 Tax=Ustilago trichophora TaxID=86804 RepID=A0A5C3EDV1_9BASI|nr:uncharacterized protein UTRI_04990 [Ustilago trichophora]
MNRTTPFAALVAVALLASASLSAPSTVLVERARPSPWSGLVPDNSFVDKYCKQPQSLQSTERTACFQIDNGHVEDIIASNHIFGWKTTDETTFVISTDLPQAQGGPWGFSVYAQDIDIYISEKPACLDVSISTYDFSYGDERDIVKDIQSYEACPGSGFITVFP